MLCLGLGLGLAAERDARALEGSGHYGTDLHANHHNNKSRFCSLAAVVVVALLSRAGEVYLYMHVI